MDMDLHYMIREATRNISERYFTTLSAGDCERWLERPYAYEFYHQLRKFLPDSSSRIISGEISKAGHPDFDSLDSKPVPDFLIHTPGTMDDNYAVIEIKHQEAKPSRIERDIDKLKTFINPDIIRYQKAVYLFYGPDLPVNTESFPEEIELWHHASPGKSASKKN